MERRCLRRILTCSCDEDGHNVELMDTKKKTSNDFGTECHKEDTQKAKESGLIPNQVPGLLASDPDDFPGTLPPFL